MLDHDEDGALGVVLNRPSTSPCGEILPDWTDVAGSRSAVPGRAGRTDSALAVGASLAHGTDPDVEPVGFRRLYDDVGIVDLDTPTELVGPAPRPGCGSSPGTPAGAPSSSRARSTRAPGTSCPSTAPDLFGADPDGLWRRVLRRQPGELAWVSTLPDDPTMN